ncbi:MAG: hypothetical protein ACK5MK_14725, partial [Dysgonomonas sp.]
PKIDMSDIINTNSPISSIMDTPYYKKFIAENEEQARRMAEYNAKKDKQNKIFVWVSFAFGTIIGISGVIVGLVS